MTARHDIANFNRTASGLYLRQAEAALSLLHGPVPQRAVKPTAAGVQRIDLDGCTLYRVTAWAAALRDRCTPRDSVA